MRDNIKWIKQSVHTLIYIHTRKGKWSLRQKSFRRYTDRRKHLQRNKPRRSLLQLLLSDYLQQKSAISDTADYYVSRHFMQLNSTWNLPVDNYLDNFILTDRCSSSWLGPRFYFLTYLKSFLSNLTQECSSSLVERDILDQNILLS